MAHDFFATNNARAILGTGPEGLCVGDIVCVLFGGDVPFILRPPPGTLHSDRRMLRERHHAWGSA
jgi:hypothetical protein